MPMNPYENLTAVACLRMEAARKGRYGQSAGSVDTSQAKCKWGLSCTAMPIKNVTLPIAILRAQLLA